jgi:hypothetical protein
MQPKKSHLDQFERTMMSAFGVQPDWYEEYWLTPKKVSPSIRATWRRRSLLSYSILCAAIMSILVYFDRSN